MLSPDQKFTTLWSTGPGRESGAVTGASGSCTNIVGHRSVIAIKPLRVGFRGQLHDSSTRTRRDAQ